MKTSQRGLSLIKEFEGCLQPIGGGLFKPYICPAGVLTIGWGTTNLDGKKFDKNTRWSQAECDAAFANNMGRYEDAVRRLVKVPLNQNQFDALVSFAYNCGEGNLGKSTLLRKLNKGDYTGAANQFAVWNKGGGRVLNGLVRRRAAEAKLFRSPAASPVPPPHPMPEVPADPMPQEVDAPPMDRPSIFEKVSTWIGGITGTGALAFFTDWRVVTVLAVSLFFAATLVIWFMGPESVRDWIRRKVNL